jgi:class 3 adenylate cyclase
VLERFGHAVSPGKTEQLFEGGLRLDGELRSVTVLEAAWHDSETATKTLEPMPRLAALNRFYESVQDAVDRHHGSVLFSGEGRVLACWGAPFADGQALSNALGAAWDLQAQLKVWASQQFLRGASAAKWGLGVASGQVSVGLVGPKGRQRYTVLGGPVMELRGLAQREGGPWLDERSVSAVKAPFAVQVLAAGSQLCAGPEAAPPTASELGFQPGEKL